MSKPNPLLAEVHVAAKSMKLTRASRFLGRMKYKPASCMSGLFYEDVLDLFHRLCGTSTRSYEEDLTDGFGAARLDSALDTAHENLQDAEQDVKRLEAELAAARVTQQNLSIINDAMQHIRARIGEQHRRNCRS